MCVGRLTLTRRAQLTIPLLRRFPAVQYLTVDGYVHDWIPRLACVLAVAPCAAIDDTWTAPAPFQAPQSAWAQRLGDELARDARNLALSNIEARKSLQDDRLRQCEAEGQRWEECVFFGTGGDRRGSSGSPSDAPRADARRPPTW